jgi:4-hydroxy-tetrahydrodipicolinate reductase
MDVIIAGSGKLARELHEQSSRFDGAGVYPWADRASARFPAVVVHAGSGRQRQEVNAFCAGSGYPLLELSTGQAESPVSGFPLIICPNANILMLKFMLMMQRSGPLLQRYEISITESHQASKQSVPGTAVHLAESLGQDSARIRSIRDAASQTSDLRIPSAHLERHAFHEIVVRDASCTLTLQSRVEGATPYVDGVVAIVRAIAANRLDNRAHHVIELIENGWV